MGKMLSPNSIKTCWIAEVKRSLGFPMRRAWNSGRGQGAPPCPAHIRPVIERVLRESPGLTYAEIQQEVVWRLAQ